MSFFFIVNPEVAYVWREGVMEAPRRFVPVWDPLLRILHWWNAAALLIQAATGVVMALGADGLAPEVKSTLVTIHAAFGYAFGAGIAVRILWLFMGPAEALWSDLLPVTKRGVRVLKETILFYLKGLRGETPLYFAHNTFAGVIYAGFFLLAIVQVVTGAVILDMAEADRGASEVLVVHGLNFLLLAFFVVAHVFAVFVHELVEKHSIISAMVHGKKAFTEEELETLKKERVDAKRQT